MRRFIRDTERRARGIASVSCHMPMTSFARMNRSDHSTAGRRLPAGNAGLSVTQRLQSLPQRQRRGLGPTGRSGNGIPRDYQARVLYRASLVDAARKRDWGKLEEMLQYIESRDRDEGFPQRPSSACWSPPRLRELCRHWSGRQGTPSPPRAPPQPSKRWEQAGPGKVCPTIAAACGDEYRLVRLSAAAALASYPGLKAAGDYADKVAKSRGRIPCLAASLARPVDIALQPGQLPSEVATRSRKRRPAYERALRIEPRSTMTMVERLPGPGSQRRRRKRPRRFSEGR